MPFIYPCTPTITHWWWRSPLCKEFSILFEDTSTTCNHRLGVYIHIALVFPCVNGRRENYKKRESGFFTCGWQCSSSFSWQVWKDVQDISRSHSRLWERVRNNVSQNPLRKCNEARLYIVAVLSALPVQLMEHHASHSIDSRCKCLPKVYCKQQLCKLP